MSNILINVYVERLLKEVTELTKNKLVLESQLIMSEKVNNELSVKLAELEKAEEARKKKTAKKEEQQF